MDPGLKNGLGATTPINRDLLNKRNITTLMNTILPSHKEFLEARYKKRLCINQCVKTKTKVNGKKGSYKVTSDINKCLRPLS